MQHTFASDTHFIFAEAPGLFRSPPALKLLLVGGVLLATGLFVISGAAFACFREFEFASILVLLIGSGVGALITWIGIVGIRWATAAAWGVTEITLTTHVLRVHRAHLQAEVIRADFRSTFVTDQFRLSNELLVTARGHRIIRVLSGRSVGELSWLAHLIELQLSNKPEPNVT